MKKIRKAFFVVILAIGLLLSSINNILGTIAPVYAEDNVSETDDYITVTKYSHTDNITDDGKQLNNISPSTKKTEVITIPSAQEISITIKMEGTGELYIFTGNHPKYTKDNFSKENKQDYYGSNGAKFTVESNSVTFVWVTNGTTSDGTGGYGYYATITGKTNRGGIRLSKEITQTSSGSASVKLVSGPEFNEKIPDTASNVEFTDENSPDGTETVDLSEAKDNGVVGWLDGDTWKVSTRRKNTNTVFNEDSSHMFERFNKFALTSPSVAIDYSPVFNNCSECNNINKYTKQLRAVKFKYIDTSNVVNMHNMFALNTEQQGTHVGSNLDTFFISGIELFKTSKVTDMSGMFFYSNSNVLNQSLNFDTHNVTNMKAMFCGNDEINTLDISSFDISKVENMEGMFSNCSSLTKIIYPQKFDTSNVKDMSYMFFGDKELKNLNLSFFNTSNVTKMAGMFGLTCPETINISSFNTSHVTDMSFMFSFLTSSEKIDVSHFNTSNVTDMYGMFWGLNDSNTVLNIKNFNTAKVTDMSLMFSMATGLKAIVISDLWDISNVLPQQTTQEMFSLCTNIVGESGVTYTENKIDVSMANAETGYLTKDFEKWKSNYDKNHTDYNENYPVLESGENFTNLISNYSNLKTIKFSNESCPDEYQDTLDYTNATSDDECLIAYWYESDTNTLVFSTENSEYKIRFNEDCSNMFISETLENIIFDNVDTSHMENASGMFYYCPNLKELDLSNFDTQSLTDTSNMFATFDAEDTFDFGAKSPFTKIYVGDKWNMSNVTNSENMFLGCSNLVGQSGTTYDENKLDASMANYDTGYLTYKKGSSSALPLMNSENDTPVTTEISAGQNEENQAQETSALITRQNAELPLTVDADTSNTKKDTYFVFTITLTDKDNKALTGTVTYSDVTFVNGVAKVSLKNRDSLLITGIPDGYHYSVVEANANGYNRESKNDSGTIAKGDVANVSFENVKTKNHDSEVEETGSFRLTKTVVSDNKETDESSQMFDFTINLALPIARETYTYQEIASDGTKTEKTFTVGNDGNAVLNCKLSNKAQLYIPELPVNTEVVVTESPSDFIPSYSGTIAGKTSITGKKAENVQTELTTETFKIGSGKETSINFLNTTASSQSLTVSKSVKGNMGNKNKEFEFHIKSISDRTINAIKSNGEKLSFAGNNIHFSLKDGESITFTDLSKSDIDTLKTYQNYGITESDYKSEGYITSYKIITDSDGNIAVQVTNTKNSGVPTGNHITTGLIFSGFAIIVGAIFFILKHKKA